MAILTDEFTNRFMFWLVILPIDLLLTVWLISWIYRTCRRTKLSLLRTLLVVLASLIVWIVVLYTFLLLLAPQLLFSSLGT